MTFLHSVFYNHKSDLPLVPMLECISPDRPMLYKPMTFNEYRMYISRKGPHGKSQLTLSTGTVDINITHTRLHCY